MPDLNRVRVAWTGLRGMPGVSTFYADATGGVPNIAALRSFFDTIKTFLPTGLTITVANQGDRILESTGALVGTWSTASVLPVVCSGTGNYAAPVGMQVSWQTEGVHRGRRLRGRTFIVPYTGLDTTGRFAANWVTPVKTAADALIAATGPDYGVWGRPSKPTAKSPNTPVSAGLWSPYTSAVVNDYPVVLTSRRD